MIEVIEGDCLDSLKRLDSETVQCVVTSPPYFGLRDYGVAGQVGMEKSPEEYTDRMVDIFRDIRRVLRQDGTVWLNLGDSYARDSGKGQHKPGDAGKQTYLIERGGGRAAQQGIPVGLKSKDLIGIPWRIAFALQADGWYLRQDIIWHKPNPMPESVRDRCTKSHEYIFMLTKSSTYHYDCDAVAEPVAASTIARISQANLANQKGSDRVPGKTNGNMKAVVRKQDGTGNRQYTGFNERYFDGSPPPLKRNRRSVWTVTTKPFKGAHFATFPQDLIEPCILAGSRPGDIVLDPFCGSGTTGVVALRHGRQFIGLELNPEYVAMSRERIRLSEPRPTGSAAE